MIVGMRRTAKDTGALGERAAIAHAQRRGWRVIGRNWTGGGGEIDIVLRRGSVVAFCEVKTRASADALTEPLTHRQHARIVRAATAFLARVPLALGDQARIDLITVDVSRRFRRIQRTSIGTNPANDRR